MLTFARDSARGEPPKALVCSGGGSLGGFFRNPSPSWDCSASVVNVIAHIVLDTGKFFSSFRMVFGYFCITVAARWFP